MFVVDLYLTFSYFVSFVHVYCSDSLVRLMSTPCARLFCCNSFNACRPLRTLGARDFSSAVSGLCQVFIVTRAKSLWSRALLL